MAKNLRRFVERNLIEINEDHFQKKRNTNTSQEWRCQDKLVWIHSTQRQKRRQSTCIYCGLYDHKVAIASKYSMLQAEKKFLERTNYVSTAPVMVAINVVEGIRPHCMTRG